MELKGKTIHFLGDSITEGYGTSGEDKRYFEIMKGMYGIKAVNCYGISGSRIAKQTVPVDIEDTRAERYFSSRIDEMDADADIIFIFGGTNDFGHGDAPIGKFGDRTVDTFYGALHVLFTKMVEKYPEATIVVATPLHRENEYCLRGCGIKTKDYAPLITYVDVIKEVARYYSLPVCDLYANSGLQPAIPVIKEKYIPDGLHPNDDGHKVLAEKIGKFMLNL